MDASQATSRNSIHMTGPRCQTGPCCSPRTKTKLRAPSMRTVAYKARTADCGKYLLWKSPLDPLPRSSTNSAKSSSDRGLDTGNQRLLKTMPKRTGACLRELVR